MKRLSTLLVVLNAVCLAVCAPPGLLADNLCYENPCMNPEIPDMAIHFPKLDCTDGPCYRKCGELMTLGFTAYDCDCIYGRHTPPDGCMDGLSFPGWPGTVTPDERPDHRGEYIGIFEMMPNGPYELSRTITAVDEGCGCDDGDPSQTIDIHWVGVDKINGPGTVCTGQTAVFSATTKYGDGTHDDWLEWKVDGGATAGTGGSFSSSWSTPGQHLVTVCVGACCKSVVVSVEAPPECYDIPPDQLCSGGTGCSSGSCSGGGFPMPWLSSPYVPPNITVPYGFVGPGIGPGEDIGRLTCRRAGDMEVQTCGSDKYIFRWDCYGRCHMENITGQQSGTYPLGPDMQVTLGANDTYTARDSAGNVRKMRLVTNGGKIGRLIRSGFGESDEIGLIDARGNETRYERSASGSGALEAVILPTGETWYYGHEGAATRITSATAPNGAVTTISYVPDGWAAGYVETVEAKKGTETLFRLDYRYDAQGRLEQVARENGIKVRYGYDTNFITVKECTATDQVISQTEYSYGPTTTTVTRVDPTGIMPSQSTVYEFHMIGYRKMYTYKVTDPQNNLTTYTVEQSGDFRGRVNAVQDALSHTISYQYNLTTGLLEMVTYPGGYTEEYTYYGSTPYMKTAKNIRDNYTFYVRDAEQSSWKLDAIKVHEPVNGNAPTDQEWESYDPIKEYFYYDGDETNGLRGMLFQERIPRIEGTSPEVTEYGYLDENGTTPRSSPTTITYQYWDDSSYSSATERTVYDDMGNVLSVTDARSRSVVHTYDDLGRQLMTTYGTGGPTTTSRYSSCCGLDRTKDENGNYTHYVYDDAKHMTDVWTDRDDRSTAPPQGAPLVHYTYDGLGNVHTVTTYSDASTGRTTTYSYDADNRVVQIDHPAPLGDEFFCYDAVGNLQGKKDGSGAVTAYEYDNLNRLTKVKHNYPAWPVVLSQTPIVGPNVTYTYCGGSRLRETMVDSTGTSRYDYDIQDRLTSYTPPQPASRTISYTYNNLNQKTSMSNGSFQVYYDYFRNGWLKEVRLGTSPVARYTYDAVGNRTRVNLGNTTYTTYSYDTDPRYRMSAIAHFRMGTPDVLLGQIEYVERDGAGNPLTMVDSAGTTGYTYDMYNRLETVTYPEPQQVTSGYDWVGNRLNPPENPNPMEYNAADQLTRWPGNHRYTYYDTGSMHGQWNDGMTTLQKTYQYTPTNLLSSVVHEDVAGDPMSAMTWDADDNRISFTSSTGGTWQFVYDTTAGIPAVIEENDGTSPIYYVREPGGELIASISGTTEPVYRYYHFDALGSTRLLTDGSGTVTDNYTYDAWGKVVAHTGTTGQPYGFVGRLGYYTHWQDQNLFTVNARQFLQLGVRFYGVENGRFSQRDRELRYEDSPYQYSRSSPAYLVDPSGRSPVACHIEPAPCDMEWFFACVEACIEAVEGEFPIAPRKLKQWCGNFCAKFRAVGCRKLYNYCVSKGDTRYGQACMLFYMEVCQNG